VRAGALAQRVQQVEQGRIDGADIAAAEVAQQMVHGAQRIRQVGAGAEVLQLEPLAGVQVVEGQHARLAAARPSSQRERGEGGDESAAGQGTHERSHSIDSIRRHRPIA